MAAAHDTGRRTGIASMLAFLLVYLAAMAIYFHDPLLSHFGLVFGHRGDAIIEIAILEHWRNVFHGWAAWNRTFYFLPASGTLAYNDGYLLHGLFFTGWRSAFDPFLSDVLTAATLRTIGYAATYWLVARTLGWGRPLALLVALLLTISNNAYLHSVHAQSQSLALLPVLMILALGAYRDEMAGLRRTARFKAAGAAAVIGLWLLTAYYFIWFTLYLTLACTLCWAWLSGNYRPRRLIATLAPHRGTLAVAAIAFLIAVVPFLSLYIPKVLETGGQRYMIKFLTLPIDVFNVGSDNLLWGWINQGLQAGMGAISDKARRWTFSMEHESGYPLVLLALIVVSLRQVLREAPRASFLRVYAMGILISWALTLQLWFLSPWLLVHHLVPGAGGLRIVVRYQLFLTLPLLLLVAAAQRERAARLWKARPALLVAIVALLIAEQVNLARQTGLDRHQQLAELETIPRPPAGCRAFSVVTARRAEPMFESPEMHRLYPHNVDAMYLSERWRLPTVNGFSTFNPPHWDFADPTDPSYEARVRAYAARFGLTGLCELDMRQAAPWRRL